MRKRDRAMVAAAKPLRGGSTKRCQLHIRVGRRWWVGGWVGRWVGWVGSS